MRNTLYEVAVDAPIAGTLTYSHPDLYEAEIAIGSCVVVPLGRRHVSGFVLKHKSKEETDCSFTIKAIVDVFTPAPYLPLHLIPLYKWVATYYHHAIGQVIKTALPVSPTVKSKTRLVLTKSGQQKKDEILGHHREGGDREWLSQLLETSQLSSFLFAGISKHTKEKKLLKQLVQLGYVAKYRDIQVAESREKTEIVYCFADTILDFSGFYTSDIENCICFDSKDFAPKAFKPSEIKTLSLINNYFIESKKQTTIPRKFLLEKYKNCSPALNSLCKKGVLVKQKRNIYRNPFVSEINTTPPLARPETLSGQQQAVFDAILPAVEGQTFTSFLLHGVTGSGKTEVYLRAVEKVLLMNKTALVLVPEIALASQLERQFLSRFKDKFALFHSGLSQGERFDQWQRIKKGDATVVLGARSAVFAPLKNVGLIIVDEEHDSAYKQDEGARYNGRDVAVMRAKQAACPVLLGSATPSVSSYYNSVSGKYQLLEMTKRIADRPLPEVTVVDLTSEKRSRYDLFFSDTLISGMNQTLADQKQVLLFVNRRGFSTSFICSDCGYVIQCKHCNVSLTYHKEKARLLCHYCGYSLTPKTICKECNSHNIKGIGLGVERIEEEASQLFPEARIARLDSDVASKRKNYLSILEKVRRREIDILVGTQMVAKGFDFPHITLVGVMWADAGLAMPDYKAAERTFSLLSQVTGRAGRGKSPGKVIIQTHQSHHYAVECAKNHDYKQLFDFEKDIRSLAGFPPFSRMVNFKLSNTKEKQVESAAKRTAALITSSSLSKEVVVFGPSPSPLEKVNNRYRWQIIVMSRDIKKLHALCDYIFSSKTIICSNGTRLAVDVDPENVM